MLEIGRMDKRIALQKKTPTVTSEGTVENWATYASDVAAAVEPSSPAAIERLVGATVQTPVTHLVTIWYRERRTTPETDPGPSGKWSIADRVAWVDRNQTRLLYIGGVTDMKEAHRQLILACEERLS
jgi:head-tail adaptor